MVHESLQRLSWETFPRMNWLFLLLLQLDPEFFLSLTILYPPLIDLRLHSGRSETEIKDVLKEIAVYERSGENKNSWGLKKEYQVSSIKGNVSTETGAGSVQRDGSPGGNGTNGPNHQGSAIV